jgi:hypothetical protein
MTFLCRNVPGFCQQIFALLFLVSTNSFFHENLNFWMLTRPCFTCVGIPLASNPDLLKFLHTICQWFCQPSEPCLYPCFPFFNKQWWRSGGGRGIKCGKVESMFNQELTPIWPRPNLKLFDPLHCYKKFIHAVGDHHWPRKNIRLVRTQGNPGIVSLRQYKKETCERPFRMHILMRSKIYPYTNSCCTFWHNGYRLVKVRV